MPFCCLVLLFYIPPAPETAELPHRKTMPVPYWFIRVMCAFPRLNRIQTPYGNYKIWSCVNRRGTLSGIKAVHLVKNTPRSQPLYPALSVFSLTFAHVPTLLEKFKKITRYHTVFTSQNLPTIAISRGGKYPFSTRFPTPIRQTRRLHNLVTLPFKGRQSGGCIPR